MWPTLPVRWVVNMKLKARLMAPRLWNWLIIKTASILYFLLYACPLQYDFSGTPPHPLKSWLDLWPSLSNWMWWQWLYCNFQFQARAQEVWQASSILLELHYLHVNQTGILHWRRTEQVRQTWITTVDHFNPPLPSDWPADYRHESA